MWTNNSALPKQARLMISARVVMRDELGAGPRSERPLVPVGFLFSEVETMGEIIEFEHRDFGVQYAVIQLSDTVDVQKGLRFRIRNGNRIVGTGQIIQVL